VARRSVHRVIQWNTGNVGYYSLRHIVAHPDLELVGVHAHNPEMVSKDAAALCGLSKKAGITATNDADALLALDEIAESFERGYAEQAFDPPMMHVPKNTFAAVRFSLEGKVNGKPIVVTEHVNRLRQDIAPDWPSPPGDRPGGHRCIVRGNPSVQLECFLEGEDGDHNTGGVQATALRVINTIPAVCEHAPGPVTTFDLPYTPSRNLKPGSR